MQPIGIRVRRRSVLVLGAAGVANVLTACSGETPTEIPDAERLGQYPSPVANDASGALAFSPKGDVLAATGKGQLALLPAAMATGGGGQPISRSVDGGHELVSVAWSPDGARIASLDNDTTLQFWTAAGEPTHAVTLPGFDPHGKVRWSPAGNLVALSNRSVPYLVDVSAAAPGPLVPGREFLGMEDLAWAPDGRTFYLVSFDGAIRLPAGAGDPLATLGDPDLRSWLAVAVAPDGRVVVAARRKTEAARRKTEVARHHTDFEDVIRVCPADLTKPGPAFEIPAGCSIVTAIRFSSDARRVVVRFFYGPIGVWEVTGVKARLVGLYREHSKVVKAQDGLAWQPGSDRIASLDANGSVHLWRPRA